MLWNNGLVKCLTQFKWHITDKLKNTGKRAIGRGDPRNSEHSDGDPDRVKCLKRSRTPVKSSPCRPPTSCLMSPKAS